MQKHSFDLAHLKAWFEEMPVGRTKHALDRMLKGEVVNLAEYPVNPNCKRNNHRSTDSFVLNSKSSFGRFKCVSFEESKVFIPELRNKKMPKSFLGTY